MKVMKFQPETSRAIAILLLSGFWNYDVHRLLAKRAEAIYLILVDDLLVATAMHLVTA
jgi:hypothetical protein